MNALVARGSPIPTIRTRRTRMRSRMLQVTSSVAFWRAFRPRIPHALWLGLVIGLMDALRSFPVLVGDAPATQWSFLLFDLGVVNVLGAGIVIAAITWAEHVRVRPGLRFPLMGATVLISALIATVVKVLVAMRNSGDLGEGFESSELLALSLYTFWMSSATGALAAFYYEFWERAAQSAARLRSAELERQGIEQRVVESRLSVMKARIEPAFLFSSIATVQKLYRANTDAAEKLLDDLIVYLRAALPQMRGKNSSLGDEIHLAASYFEAPRRCFRRAAAYRFRGARGGARNPVSADGIAAIGGGCRTAGASDVAPRARPRGGGLRGRHRAACHRA